MENTQAFRQAKIPTGLQRLVSPDACGVYLLRSCQLALMTDLGRGPDGPLVKPTQRRRWRFSIPVTGPHGNRSAVDHVVNPERGDSAHASAHHFTKVKT